MRALVIIINIIHIKILVYCIGEVKLETNFTELFNTKSNETDDLMPRLQYGFFRSNTEYFPGTVLRLNQGKKFDINEFPTIAALLDKDWKMKCSATIISQYWVLTSGHCVSLDIAYIKYNTVNPTSKGGNISPVLYHYRHPYFQVEYTDKDVTFLQNDIGLLRAQNPLVVKGEIPIKPSLTKYNADVLDSKEAEVISFDPTTEESNERYLHAVNIIIHKCEPELWFNVSCGAPAVKGQSGWGICVGDSGGPVLFNRTQIGISSMRPLNCINTALPGDTANSVFTNLFGYATLIDSIREANERFRDEEISLKRTRRDGQEFFIKSVCNSLRANLYIIMVVVVALLF